MQLALNQVPQGGTSLIVVWYFYLAVLPEGKVSTAMGKTASADVELYKLLSKQT